MVLNIFNWINTDSIKVKYYDGKIWIIFLLELWPRRKNSFIAYPVAM